MKKILSLLFAVILVLSLFGCADNSYAEEEAGEEETEEIGELELFDDGDYDWERFKDDGITLNIFNWGEYIADGINDKFTELTGIKINYSNYDTNETMYAKISGGGASYDIIIPSDYMIARMINENLVLKLDFDNIPNAKYIKKNLDTSYDKNLEYSVAYTWGLVGLIYNTNYVDEEDVQSWDVMWDEKYKGKVLMFNNSRDAFMIAQKKLGYKLNTENEEEWEKSYDLLVRQKPYLYSYVADEVFNKMESGECWIAPYYAGDFITMYEVNEDLAFSYPKEGTNVFVDAMCVPLSSKHKEAAEMYINFMSDPNVAKENINYIWYFTPNEETEKMDDYFANCDLDEVSGKVVADEKYLSVCETYTALSPGTQKKMENLWLLVKKSEVGWELYVITAALFVFALTVFVRKKIKQSKEKRK